MAESDFKSDYFCPDMSLKFVSWNVNGVRAVAKKGLVESVCQLNPDFLLLQETKAPKEEALNALALLSDYRCFANSSKARKGYSVPYQRVSAGCKHIMVAGDPAEYGEIGE